MNENIPDLGQRWYLLRLIHTNLKVDIMNHNVKQIIKTSNPSVCSIATSQKD